MKIEKMVDMTAAALGTIVLISVIAAAVDVNLIISILTPSPGVGSNVTVGAQRPHSGENKFVQFIWIAPNGTIARTSPLITATSVGGGQGVEFANDSFVVDAAGTWNLTAIFLKEPSAEVGANFVTFSVTGTCTLSATPINFENMNPGDTSTTDQSTTLHNGGTVAATGVTIQGTDWSGSGNSMYVGQTRWSLASGQNYDTGMTNVTSSAASLTSSLGAGSNLPIYFKLRIPPHQAGVTYTQTITFTGSC
jgi:hypothetical protein